MRCLICNCENPAGVKSCTQCGIALISTVNEPNNGSEYLPLGTKLQDGAYSVVAILGQGGFGITYLGNDTNLNRQVAIKEFFPTGCSRRGQTVQPSSSTTSKDYEISKAKSSEEAKSLAQFNHPSIVKVFTVFEENNTVYTVMEFLKGKTLQELLEEKGVIPESETLGYAEQIGEALATVHQKGLLHRDIKPDNVLVTEDGRAVLIDFGAARTFAPNTTARMTRLLTEAYAPLEQYAGEAKFGPFTDIYALGATLYHLLTGKIPVNSADRVSNSIELLPPRQLNSKISSIVSDAIISALEIKVDQRPQSMQDFLDALRGKKAGSASTRQYIKDLATALENWYCEQGFDSHQIDKKDGSILVQAKKGGWRNVVGMSAALDVLLRLEATKLIIEIRGGKWVDKAASVVLLGPVTLATSAYGVWRQTQLPKRTSEFIREYSKNQSGRFQAEIQIQT